MATVTVGYLEMVQEMHLNAHVIPGTIVHTEDKLLFLPQSLLSCTIDDQ